MFVLIDMERLLFLHKHENRAVLVNLAHIECASAAVTIGMLNETTTYTNFTLLDLQLLYKHTTGQALPGYSLPTAIAAIIMLAKRIGESDVVPEEVLAQALTIPWKSKEHFVYVKGARTPTKPAGLFLPEGLKFAADQLELDTAKKYVAAPVAPPYVPPPPPAPKPPRAPRVPGAQRTQTREPGVGSGPAPGTLTARIYARCQEMLDMNNRENAAQVSADSVRLHMAKKLIEEGVNASTARRQTMEWMRSLK